MTRPRLLDLCCGEGGSARGYADAGFDVFGVDIAAMPRYPFAFTQADALTYPLDGFDAVHASPPCQRWSVTRVSHDKSYPDLLTPLVERLRAWGGVWVVENVPSAPVPEPVTLCGAALGCTAIDDDGTPLVLKRHRLFGGSIALHVPPCACAVYRAAGYRVAGLYGGGREDRTRARRAGKRGGYTPLHATRLRLLGVDAGMSLAGMSQAIPVAYTALIGAQMMRAVRQGLAA